jgi:hypothetical protein
LFDSNSKGNFYPYFRYQPSPNYFNFGSAGSIRWYSSYHIPSQKDFEPKDNKKKEIFVGNVIHQVLKH